MRRNLSPSLLGFLVILSLSWSGCAKPPAADKPETADKEASDPDSDANAVETEEVDGTNDGPALTGAGEAKPEDE